MKKYILFILISLLFTYQSSYAKNEKQFIIYGDSLSTWFCLGGKEVEESKIWFNYLNSNKNPLIFSEIGKTMSDLYWKKVKDKHWNFLWFDKVPYEEFKYWFSSNKLNNYSLFLKHKDWYFTFNKEINSKVPLINNINNNKLNWINIILLGGNDMIYNTNIYNKLKSRESLKEINLNEALKCKDLNCINKLKINSNWSENIGFITYKNKTLKDYLIDYLKNKDYQQSFSDSTWFWAFLNNTTNINKNSKNYIVLLPYYLIENKDNNISKKEYLNFKINLNKLIKNKKNINLIEITEWEIKKYLKDSKLSSVFCEDKMHFNEYWHKVIGNLISSKIN